MLVVRSNIAFETLRMISNVFAMQRNKHTNDAQVHTPKCPHRETHRLAIAIQIRSLRSMVKITFLPSLPHSMTSSLPVGLRLLLRALPFAGGRPPLLPLPPLPPEPPGGGRTKAKSTSIV
jgi:hypothetical protein